MRYFSDVEKSVLRKKSYAFAIRVVMLSKTLQDSKEYIISRQFLRSGTAIGALIREAEFGQSRADFVNKMSIALKEANETAYWLLLLKDTGYLQEKELFASLQSECAELIAMLAATVKTMKMKN
jgi:four helix bundle protein